MQGYKYSLNMGDIKFGKTIHKVSLSSCWMNCIDCNRAGNLFVVCGSFFPEISLKFQEETPIFISLDLCLINFRISSSKPSSCP